MSIAFSRSLRSLNKDRSNSNLALVILLGVAIVCWLYWFAFGELTLYANSQKFVVADGGSISVQFSEVDLAKLRPGMRGVISFAPAKDDAETSYEVEVTNLPETKEGNVEVFVFGDTSTLAGQQATVRINVGKTAPLFLVWNQQKLK